MWDRLSSLSGSFVSLDMTEWARLSCLFEDDGIARVINEYSLVGGTPR
ncbi:MAG: hypothetical protein WBE26_04760 [Phycisphaerae bacterium]